MLRIRVKKAVLALLLLPALSLAGPASASSQSAALPQKTAPVTGVSVYKNEKGIVDASNLAEGYLLVAYTGGKAVPIKVQVKKSGGTTYTYTLNNKGATETLPLTEGDGEYQVTIYENVTGAKYASAYSCTLNLKLRNAFLPFLYSNQYVNFNADSTAVKKAAEICQSDASDLEEVKTVFNFVTTTLVYDTELAKTVQSGYLPNIDQVLANKKGICFDYAALMTAMLRSRGIPCKLVVGYAGTAYHAWINVYIDEVGWVNSLIYFDGTNWKMMDPTFTSAAGGDANKLKKYIGDGSSYVAKYAY